ncbi:hypothetical protein JCM24511_01122 [Saitozyma sp. JCM 24511]|nr:hypothetical protein JCM24511_01122 [Saitozyma sp. JCM 24511]
MSRTFTSLPPRRGRSITLPLLPLVVLLAVAFVALPAAASSGDRNPTFQHCLRGCQLTYCDPSQPPISPWLRMAGWSCVDNCKYSCAHSFTDNIRAGGRWHQFYGKWPFYRLGPIQEPISALASLGNLFVNLKGLEQVRRRVRQENGLRRWLEVLAFVQVNTWVWSAVFHCRDTPFTERLDYLSATITIAYTLLYTVLRVTGLLTPLRTSRLAIPVAACFGLLVVSHWTYLLSFPAGAFPYGYHTKFNLVLAAAHNLLWILWTTSFYVTIPPLQIGRWTFALPHPYPPNDPRRVRAKDANTPAVLVGLTTLAMSFELLDFAPVFRLLDAHALWHIATIPLAVGWWTFLCNDAIELEGSLLNARGVSAVGADAKMPLTGGAASTNLTEKQKEKERERAELDAAAAAQQIKSPSFSQVASGAATRD